jgi:hypothetical protein
LCSSYSFASKVEDLEIDNHHITQPLRVSAAEQLSTMTALGIKVRQLVSNAPIGEPGELLVISFDIGTTQCESGVVHHLLLSRRNTDGKNTIAGAAWSYTTGKAADS